MFPVECVARGYLTGSGLLDYRAHRPASAASRCPPASQDGTRLPEPIFTPATKADGRRPRRERRLRARSSRPSGDDEAAELRDADLEVYARADAIARDPRHHPGRHQVRVRRAGPDGDHGLADEVLTPGLLALLAGRRVAAGPRPAVVRQADRPRLADLAGVRLGPHLRRRPAAAAGRGRRAHPRALRRGLRAADRGDVLTAFRAAVDLPRARGGRLRLPLRPPQPARSGSRRCARSPCRSTRSRTSGSAGRETTSVGVRPQMEIIEMDPPHVWAERGRWRGRVRDTDPRLRAVRRVGAASRSAATSPAAGCTPCRPAVAGRLAGPAVAATCARPAAPDRATPRRRVTRVTTAE